MGPTSHSDIVAKMIIEHIDASDPTAAWHSTPMSNRQTGRSAGKRSLWPSITEMLKDMGFDHTKIVAMLMDHAQERRNGARPARSEVRALQMVKRRF
jgi:hypothetical protein